MAVDDIVRAAMKKWPNVPACYGWLGLDARGNWYMRDDAAQALGGFASGVSGAKGSLLQHQGLIAFIQRNYFADERGCWCFQNGPQRVFVELEAAPWVLRVADTGAVTRHDGLAFNVQHVFTCEREWLYFSDDSTLGIVHTQDMLYAARLLETSAMTVHETTRAALQQRFGFAASPQQLYTETETAEKTEATAERQQAV